MNITFEQAIKGFQLYNEAAGKSRKTYLWYGNNLNNYHKWLEKQVGHKPQLDEVTHDMLRNFLTEACIEVE